MEDRHPQSLDYVALLAIVLAMSLQYLPESSQDVGFHVGDTTHALLTLPNTTYTGEHVFWVHLWSACLTETAV